MEITTLPQTVGQKGIFPLLYIKEIWQELAQTLQRGANDGANGSQQKEDGGVLPNGQK